MRALERLLRNQRQSLARRPIHPKVEADMLNTRRIIIWGYACAFALVLVSAFVIHWRGSRPQLPDAIHYGKLPEEFNRALLGARARAASGASGPAAVRELAHLYQANWLYPEARACYKVIASGPGGLSAQDHYYLAAIAQDDSDLVAAQAELRATLEAEPRYVPARVALAEVLFKSGQSDDAAKEYTAVLGIEAYNPQAMFGLARIEQQRGNEAGAVSGLRDLMARHPDSTSGAALLATILEHRSEAEEAAAMRSRSVQKQEPVPPDPWMKAMLADCYDLTRLGLAFEQYQKSGQMDEALPMLDRLDELDPEGWTAPMLRGWSRKQAGQYPEAVREYRLALTHGGNPERICPLLVAALLTEHKDKEAASVLAEYRAKLPHSIPILLSYSEVAVRMGDEALARSLLTEVLQAEPYLYMPNMSMVQILWSAGEHDAAAKCLQRVATTFPADIDSRGLLGQYFMEKSDPWSAIAPLEQAVGLVQAKDSRRERLLKMLDTAYLAAGSLEASRGRFAESVRFSEKSIQLFPDGVRGYALKANVCRRERDFKGAAQALARLSALEPGDPAVQMSLGDVLYQGGDGTGAHEHWQRALQLAPADASSLRSALGQRLTGSIPAEISP